MKYKWAIWLLLSAALALSTSCRIRPAADEEYAVYSAYLESQILHNAHDYGDGKGVMVIRESTYHGEPLPDELKRISPHLKGIDQSTLNDFVRSNRESTSLQRKFQLPTTYLIASESDVAAGKTKSNYGLVVLSRVGFNWTDSQDLFHIDHFCGLCGGSGFVLMKKSILGRWKIQNEFFTAMT